MKEFIFNSSAVRNGEDSSISYEIEWNHDMNNNYVEFKGNGGPDKYQKIVKTKGRCKACWGSLVARRNAETQQVTGIRCRVCDELLEGTEATKEYDRMSEEESRNVFNLYWDQPLEYGEGTFAIKLFPIPNDYTEKELKKRIEAKAAEGDSRWKLTRNHFPVGSPGFFFLQAELLMHGLADISNLQTHLFAGFDDLSEVLDDGSLRVYEDVESISQDPRAFQFGLAKRMGANMTLSMLAAFACELGLKAVSLTCKDEARRSHDLLNLFQDLPSESRKRLKTDFSEIESILAENRQRFGSWRYFEAGTGEIALNALIDKPSALALGKAARVIMDECEIVGLDKALSLNTTQEIRQDGQERTTRNGIDIKVSGSENPPVMTP